jgi:hypothetical protein
MTIKKRQWWGEAGPLPPDGVMVHSDAEARAIVESARRARTDPPPLGLLGGDLCRTLGGRGDEGRIRSPEAMRFPIDVCSVLVDGRQHWFVAHLLARRSWWQGRLFAAMNAQWLGRWDLGPKSHPNDGLLDVTDTDMALGDRLKARRRLATGTHVPHPAITTRRTKALQVDFARPLDIWLDGERVARASNLSIRVEPDSLLVVV